MMVEMKLARLSAGQGRKVEPHLPLPVRGMVGKELRPRGIIEWPNKARLAVVLTFDYHGGEAAPKHPGGQTDHMKKTTYEFGLRKGIWYILETLDRYGIKATFNTCGATAEQHPESVAEIKKRGHEIAGLAYLYDNVWDMDRAQEKKVMEMTRSAIQKAVGERPQGWRTPDFAVSENTLPLLSDMGFVWDSSLLNDDLPYALEVDKKVLVEIPSSTLINDISFYGLPFPPRIPREVMSAWQDEVEVLYREAQDSCRMFVPCLHPFLTGRPSELQAFDRFLSWVCKFEGLWFARCCDVARWWIEHEYWI